MSGDTEPIDTVTAVDDAPAFDQTELDEAIANANTTEIDEAIANANATEINEATGGNVNQTQIDEATAEYNALSPDDKKAAMQFQQALDRGDPMNQTSIIMVMQNRNATFNCTSQMLPIPMQDAASWASVGCLPGFYCKWSLDTRTPSFPT